MATVQYRLSSKVYDNRSEVLIRFYDGTRFSQRAKSHIVCPVSAWDSKEGMPVIPKKANTLVTEIVDVRQRLDGLREFIFSRWFAVLYDDLPSDWLQSVVDEFSAPKKSTRPTLTDVFEEYIIAKNIDASTQRQYRVLLSALTRFGGKRVWYIDGINVHDIEAFCAWFRREKVGKEVTLRSQNTITGRVKKWRALMNFAVQRGYISFSPFAQFSIPTEVYGTPIFLTTDERNALYSFRDLSPAMTIQRDIFIFQCHVGCRVSDLLSLTKDNVTDDGFLQYIPQKQRRRVPITVRVPLSGVAKEIINRYADSNSEKLLPFIHSVLYNRAIHKFMRTAGLDRTVMVLNKLTMQPEYKPLWEVCSSHTARKTFIEAMFRETKSERITSAFTGHTNGSRAFSRYTDVDDDMKRSILSALENKNI